MNPPHHTGSDAAVEAGALAGTGTPPQCPAPKSSRARPRSVIALGAGLFLLTAGILILLYWRREYAPIIVEPGSHHRVLRARATPIPRMEAFADMLNRVQQTGAIPGYRNCFKTNLFYGNEGNMPQGLQPGYTIRPDECGFDLWSVAASLRAPKDSSIAVSFEISTETPQTVFLGLGGSDQYILFCNGAPQYAVLGIRSLVFNHDLCRVETRAGVNRITVVYQRRDSWTSIPGDHFQPEWATDIEIYGAAEIAWANHAANVFHPLDVAILPTLDKVRVEASAEGHTKAKLCRMDGTVAAFGTVQPDGTITWDPALGDNEPFFGFFVLSDQIGEPVMILSGATVDDAVKLLTPPPPPGNDPTAKAWRFRLQHLVKPEFKPERGRTWTRKVVQALAMAALSQNEVLRKGWQARCPSLRVDLHAYKSAIDGTQQYYHIYKCSGRESQVPLVVAMPPVPATIRPYLESATIANFAGLENLAVMAEQMNVDVLWPGIVDIDYGGRLGLKEISECMNEVLTHNPKRYSGLYLYGLCAAGLSAINGSNDGRPINGVVLHTPVVSRGVPKKTTDLSFSTHFPPDVLAAEDTYRNLGSLAKTPSIMIYDCDEPGHGDRKGSRKLEEQLKELRADCESHWPNAWVTMPWGERDNMVTKHWLRWINQKAATLTASESPGLRSHAFTSPATVKEALLQGYAVDSTSDAFFSKWMSSWGKSLASYRGATTSELSRDEARTQVHFRVLTKDEMIPDHLQAFMPGQPVLQTLYPAGLEIDSSAILFGFRLVQTGMGNVCSVEVLRSENGNVPPPPLDLMLDGCCRGALWKYEQDSWELIDVWL